jgi:hypothetical protein
MVRAVVSLISVAVVAADLPFLPPGVQSGIEGKRASLSDVTLVLHPPEEDIADAKSSVDALLEVEKLGQRAVTADYLAAKQGLLNAEIAKIHEMVAGRRASFLQKAEADLFGDLVSSSDYEVTLHAPEESAAEMKAGISNLLKVEAEKQASTAKQFADDRAALIAAAVSKIHSTVAANLAPATAKSSFLEPFAPPIGFQTVMQAGMPTEVHVVYDVPQTGTAAQLEAMKRASDAAATLEARVAGASFLANPQTSFIGGDFPGAYPALNVLVEQPAYSEVDAAIDAEEVAYGA